MTDLNYALVAQIPGEELVDSAFSTNLKNSHRNYLVND